ncbi:fibroblast growth factor receptor homolog 2 [Drosophila subpulchrella]|uniref:fibroblast growth factor receptor homolog 2 n=1 Tax=Drosophila subpulchrella TaxID=1486046 RepID=UPI0018A1AD5C|nr:fibroblast growth factor receptor homolog 2 [Drosophila subpulchrella]XP_037711570.1 fibroblast growth factor receptor homolog 2 [Drosophila subpulchrella]
MAKEVKCIGSIATPILVIMISISRAWTMQHQHLSPAIQEHPGVKSLSNIVDGNNNLLPIVSAPSSVDNDYVYIASVNSKFPQFGNSLDDDQEAEEQQPDETTYPPPVFDFGMPRNITTRTGHTAAINCRVDNLGDKSVSWIRKRDLHILTAGILTYTSDERFKVVRTADSKDWTLHVKYAQPRDSGIYECQVNTEPKISMAFRLNVIVTPPDAKAIIAGPTDLYVKVGSSVTLTCLVKQPATSAQDIGPIYWYRGPYILTPFVAHPNDAAIDLQRISMESTLAEKLQSRLRIANAQLLDSGNYTCMPTTAEAASVVVNVINDESPAAMQKSRGIRTSGSRRSSRLVLLLAMVASSVVRWLIGGRHIGIGISNSCRDSCSNLSTLHINYSELHASHLEQHRRLGQPLVES